MAQSQSRLTGTVTDNTGAVIPGANVTISNMATGVEQTTTTNASGVYTFPNVVPGQYIVLVEFTGFKGFSQTGSHSTPASRALWTRSWKWVI